MARRGTAETLTLDVYTQLRLDIVAGRLAPGERLKPAELGKRFEVSTGVVREALARLVARNLVEVEHNRGFHVVNLTVDALTHLTLARQINEGQAIRLAIEHGDVAWESAVIAAHHQLERTPRHPSDDPGHRSDAWADAHNQFHFRILEACGNPVLLSICRMLADSAELYRGWAAAARGPQSRDVSTEHGDLMRAVLARDTELAVLLCEQHIQRTASILTSAQRPTVIAPSPPPMVELEHPA